jgi:hypothetical protein
VFVAIDEQGRVGPALRVTHDRQLHREFVRSLPEGSTIAIEASGYYSWLV